MTRHYRIRINARIYHPAMWYWNKKNSEHNATLGISYTGKPWFVVAVGKGVYAEDCSVIGEWLKE